METEADPENIYAMIGEAGFFRLVHAFYRQVKFDDVLGPLYPPGDFENAEVRLREFLIQRFGGPDRYSVARGHPRLRMRHAPFKVDQTARDRWILLMQNAMAEVELPASVEPALRKYFNDTATFMINRSE